MKSADTPAKMAASTAGPLTCVAAGILPAVAPGILPGGPSGVRSSYLANELGGRMPPNTAAKMAVSTADPLASVAAGILPAVAPGILPGGPSGVRSFYLTNELGGRMPPNTAAKMATSTVRAPREPAPAFATLRALAFAAVALVTAIWLCGCGQSGSRQIVVYTSQDQVFAEPVLKEFTRQTGIKVNAVFDSEAVKTVGLVNRLVAERNHPQCDLFWNNEELRTRQLAAQDVCSSWVALEGYCRFRRLVVNTNRVAVGQAPRSLSELTNVGWRGKVALGYPLFGTTATHFLALRQQWGEARWEAWCRALQANNPMVVDGNSVVVKQVGRGEAWVGLTDSDDIAAAQREGLPVAGVSLGEDTLSIPTTVARIKGSPHEALAGELVAYLQSKEVKARLAQMNAFEAEGGAGSPGLKVRWESLLAEMQPAAEKLKLIFLR